MRKILGLTIAALLVIGLAGVGTWAYFSDTETSTGNTFTAGTLDLQVDSQNPWTSTAITAGPMVPGATATTVNLVVDNVGSQDGDLYMKITSLADTGGDNSFDTGTEWPTSSGKYGWSSEPEKSKEQEGSDRVDDISTQITLTCTGTGVTATHIDSQTLAQAAANGYGSPSAVKVADLVGTTGTVTITFGGSLDSGADNSYQGDVSTFDVEFYLAQDGQTPP